jgi:hypothetical protein
MVATSTYPSHNFQLVVIPPHGFVCSLPRHLGCLEKRTLLRIEQWFLQNLHCFIKFWKLLEKHFFLDKMCPLSQILLSTNQERRKFKHAYICFANPLEPCIEFWAKFRYQLIKKGENLNMHIYVLLPYLNLV